MDPTSLEAKAICSWNQSQTEVKNYISWPYLYAGRVSVLKKKVNPLFIPCNGN